MNFKNKKKIANTIYIKSIPPFLKSRSNNDSAIELTL